jgi:hypothetical protein
MQQRTILLSIPTGHNLANMLRTDVLSTLLDDHSIRLVVASPFWQDQAVLDEFRDRPITFEPLSPYQPGRLGRLVESIVSEQFLRSSGLRAVRLQRDRARLLRSRPTHPSLLLAKDAVSRLPVGRSRWHALAERLEARDTYAALFDRHRPDLVATCTAGFALAEIPVIHEARRRGIPQMAIDLGWDNLSSKYHTVLPVDSLVVWNRRMRDEAVRYLGFPAANVEVAGAPQFDHYFTRADLPSRDAFFASIGGDPSRALVTLATTAVGTYETAPDIAALLARAAADGSFGRPAQVLVRLHQRDARDRYAEVERVPGVIVDRRERRLNAPGPAAQFEALSPTRQNRAHLAATLAYSDVVINFASTTTVEACIFDTPVINIGFDPIEHAPLPLSIRRYFSYEHYQPVLETGAARIAATPRELVEQVRAYVTDPGLDRQPRAELVRQVCEFTDGCSGRRVGRAVAAALHASRRRVGD